MIARSSQVLVAGFYSRHAVPKGQSLRDDFCKSLPQEAPVCRTAIRDLLVFGKCMQLVAMRDGNGSFTYWNSSNGPSEDRFRWWTARSAHPPKGIATMGNFTQRADQIRSPLEDTLASALLPVTRNPLLLQPLHLSKTPSSMPTPVTLAHRCAGVPNG